MPPSSDKSGRVSRLDLKKKREVPSLRKHVKVSILYIIIKSDNKSSYSSLQFKKHMQKCCTSMLQKH